VQYIESSVIGVRSAVITLKRRTTPLRFVLFPMVHVAERSFYDEVAARLRGCDHIVAEGTPSRYSPMQTWMARLRFDDLVDQTVALDLERLGPPVQWEFQRPEPPKNNREQAVRTATDAAAAVMLKALGRYGSPRGLPNMDEADEADDKWERAESGGLTGYLDRTILRERDDQLVGALAALHRERYTEPITVGVAWGAMHMPAVVDRLGEDYKYYVESAEWLTVVNG
jgi:hypothetical protein